MVSRVDSSVLEDASSQPPNEKVPFQQPTVNLYADKQLNNARNQHSYSRNLSFDIDLTTGGRTEAGEPSRAYEAYGWNAYKAKNQERARRTRAMWNIERQEKYTYSELLMFRVSVIPKIIWPSIVHAILATIWLILYEVLKFKFISMPPTLISVLGVAVTLVLVFRTNTAYDRYWEGRKAWSSLSSHIRNLSRFIWICVDTKTNSQLEQKYGCENLLIAYAVAMKHSLRNELGHKYEDLHYLLAHVSEFSPYSPPTTQVRNLPLYIIRLITQYLFDVHAQGLIESGELSDMNIIISHIIECGSTLDRIKTTPIPFAYKVHISHTANLYIFALPFQLVSGLHWWTIAVVLIASFVLIGLDSIGNDIENPFKLDKNGLQIDNFCNSIKEDVYEQFNRPTKFVPNLTNSSIEDDEQ